MCRGEFPFAWWTSTRRRWQSEASWSSARNLGISPRVYAGISTGTSSGKGGKRWVRLKMPFDCIGVCNSDTRHMRLWVRTLSWTRILWLLFVPMIRFTSNLFLSSRLSLPNRLNRPNSDKNSNFRIRISTTCCLTDSWSASLWFSVWFISLNKFHLPSLGRSALPCMKLIMSDCDFK